MKIYTLTGDDGFTSLTGGRRVPKQSVRIEAYGSVDEIISWVGMIRDHKENLKRSELLIYIQSQLMACASALAHDEENAKIRMILPEASCISVLESEIDKMEETLAPIKYFILPGGNLLVSYCHIARCVCRRAERAVFRLNNVEKSPEIIAKFLNRLSDYLFVLSRKLSKELDAEEVNWII